MSEKWRNENWFTSSWNFAEEVRAACTSPTISKFMM